MHAMCRTFVVVLAALVLAKHDGLGQATTGVACVSFQGPNAMDPASNACTDHSWLMTEVPRRDDPGESSGGAFGIGFQSSFPVWGISAILNTSTPLSLQGVVGFMGDLKMYGARGRYRFNTTEKTQPYAFGMVGMWTYSTESVPGLGGGIGLEYFLTPRLGFNGELGIAAVHFKEVSYTFSATTIGIGLHYYVR